ncbi:MAG: hypothetical protein ABI866_05655 [Dokdonella sp.]
MNVHSHDPKVKARLDVLEGKLEALIEEFPNDADFWNAFAVELKPILSSANAHDAEYAQGRIDCMLKNAGLIPGEDEGKPCS